MHAAAQRAGKLFFRGTGLPTVMRKNQPLVPRSNFGAQEPTPGSAVEHCRFLDTGGGGTNRHTHSAFHPPHRHRHHFSSQQHTQCLNPFLQHHIVLGCPLHCGPCALQRADDDAQTTLGVVPFQFWAAAVVWTKCTGGCACARARARVCVCVQHPSLPHGHVPCIDHPVPLTRSRDLLHRTIAARRILLTNRC